MKSDCIFCKIVADRSLQAEQKIAEDSDFLVMLTQRPATYGHTLILPKIHYSDLNEMPIGLQHLLIEHAIKIGEIVQKVFRAKAYILKVNNNLFVLEKNKGHVGHIHMHIIPRYSRAEKLQEIPPKLTVEELIKIRDKLNTGGDEVWKEQVFFQKSDQK